LKMKIKKEERPGNVARPLAKTQVYRGESKTRKRPSRSVEWSETPFPRQGSPSPSRTKEMGPKTPVIVRKSREPAPPTDNNLIATWFQPNQCEPTHKKPNSYKKRFIPIHLPY
jgi:hypothetical protein